MTPERYARLCELFEKAIQLGPSDRNTFLLQECGGDTSLQDELKQMLAHDNHDQTENIPGLSQLLNLKSMLPAKEAAAPHIGRRIGPYQLQRPLGSGGMGTVYLAARVDDFHQQVAIKLIKPGHDTQEIIRRFRTERQVLAGLNHPHIARLLDGGTTEDGLPFFVMEYIDGSPIDRHCDLNQLPTRQRIQLLHAVCQAVHHAHQHTVIHRDLKPGNILVAHDGTPKVLDFGLAKQFASISGADADSDSTQTGAILGTPSYMAPEQAGGKKSDIGPTADVYSLGAILYEMLTGRPPFRGDTPFETLQQVMTEEPVSPGRLHPRLPRDLETICLKCLEKDPAKRYPTADSLALDLGRYLSGEPILARPVSKVERVWRLCKRYPLVASLTAAVALLLLTTTVGATLMARREQLLRAESERANQDLESSLYSRGIAVAERELAVTGRQDVGRAEQLLADCPPSQRGWEWHHLHRLLDTHPTTLRGHTHGTWCVAFRPDGKEIATASIDSTVKTWDPQTGRNTSTFRGHFSVLASMRGKPVPVMCLAYSPGGKRIASGGVEIRLSDLSSPIKGIVKVWRGQDHKVLVTYRGHEKMVIGVSFSPDGRRVASAGFDNTIHVWDASTGHNIHILKGHRDWINRIAFHPDGKHLASPSMDGTVKIWDTARGQQVQTFTGHAGPVRDVEYSRDGRWLATAGMDGSVKLWDAQSGTILHSMEGHSGSAMAVAFSPDRKLLASVGFDKTVKIWHTATGKETITLRGHTDTLWSVAFSPNGKQLVSGGFDRFPRIWDAAAYIEPPHLHAITPIGHTDRVNSVAFRPDGKHLASGSWDKTVRIWDAATGENIRTLTGHQAAIWCVAYSHDGKLLASASWDRTVKIWNARTGKLIRDLTGHTTLAHGLAFSPNGQWLASTCVDGTVKVWDVRTGQGKHNLRGHLFMTYAAAFSPDSSKLATAGGDRLILIWNVATGKELKRLERHQMVVHGVAFSPDGKFLASASWDQSVKLWHVDTGKEVGDLKGHTDRVHGVAFSPDGKYLASASEDKTVRLWDWQKRREAADPRVHRGVVWSVAFSPNSRQIASASWYVRAGVKIWRVPRARK